MVDARLTFEPRRPAARARPLRVSIPLLAKIHTESGVEEFSGRLEAIDEGEARIFLEQPLSQGTRIEVLVEFRDSRNREIRFRYEAKVASAISREWYEMAVSFEEGVGISGKDAREILADVFPEEA